MEAASSFGVWNESAATLLWLLHFARRDSTLHTFLNAVLIFAQLCDFHVKQSLDRAARVHVKEQSSRLSAMRDFADGVIRGTVNWEEYKAKYDAESKWLAYLEKNWLCPRYWSLVYAPFRALVDGLLKFTTNDLEAQCFAVYKRLHEHAAGAEVVFPRILGPPSPLGVSVDSFLGVQLEDFSAVQNGDHVPQF
jgi:hypothetical protein